MALSNKRRIFIEEYLHDFNATQAAIRAGYSPKTAYSQGQRLLKNVEVKAAVESRMDELCMSAEEILFRLSEQARSSIADVIEPIGQRTFLIDIDKVAEFGHLIKKIKHTKHGVEIELYSSQEALNLLGKHRSLFKQEVIIQGGDRPLTIGVIDDWSKRIARSRPTPGAEESAEDSPEDELAVSGKTVEKDITWNLHSDKPSA